MCIFYLLQLKLSEVVICDIGYFQALKCMLFKWLSGLCRKLQL
jgi:hypothetical protein